MSLSQSSEINLTDNGKMALNAKKMAENAQSAASNAHYLANSAQITADSAQRTANGKNSVYRGDDPNTVPTAGLKEGDIYFTDNALYTWNGSSWEETVSDTTGAEIKEKVDKAVESMQKDSADLKTNINDTVKKIEGEIAQNKIQVGNALNFYKEQYYQSTSYTELVGGSWSDEMPAKTKGKYVWSRYVTANVGDPTNQQYSDPVCISGLDGEQGAAGPKGADGQTTYVHVAYANSADGNVNFNVNYFADALFIGVLTDYVQADSTDYTKYTWSRIKGDAGDQGIPGPKGDNGQTTYVHFAYANIIQLVGENTGFSLSTQTTVRFGNEDLGKWFYKDLPAGSYTASNSLFGDPANGVVKVAQAFSDFSVTESSARAYIGVYTDYTQADSTNPASYSWTKIKGETGQTGATGPKGDTGSTGFFIGDTPPPNPAIGTVWATKDSSGNMTSAKTWNGSSWVSTAFTQDLVAGNITASKIVGGELDINKITIKNAQNIPITSTVSLGDKLSNIEQDANKIKFSMAGQGLDLVDSLDGEFVMTGGIPSTTWKDGNSYLALPISIGGYSEALPTTGTQFATLYNWEAGKTYTQSIIIETDAQINTGAQPQWTWFEDGPALTHNIQPAELVSLGNNCYRLIGSYTPNGDDAKSPLRILDIWNLASFVNVATGTYLKFRSPHFFCADDNSLSELKLTSSSLDAYVNKSQGSSTLKALLHLDPNNSSIAQLVNGNPVAAINLSKEGKVQIDGSHISLNAATTIPDATIKSAMIDSLSADKLTAGTIDASQITVLNLDANNITTGTLSARINDLRKFKPYVVSPSSPWNFDDTKSAYDNWFLIGEISTDHVWNGPPGIPPYMYVTVRGTKEVNGSDRYVVTVWKDNDPTQYQRVWNGSSWSQWVMLPNSQNIVSAINLSPDSVKISGKNIELDGNTTVTGTLDLMQNDRNWVNQSTNYHNNWSWNNAHIYFDNYLQLLGENCTVNYTNGKTALNDGINFYSIATLTPGYLKFTAYQNKVNITDENFAGQIARTYIDAGTVETPDAFAGNLRIVGHHIRPTDDKFVMISNHAGTNFDYNGSVGLQVYGGVGLGQNTIYTPSHDLYIQSGNVVTTMGQSYSNAGKVVVHCNSVVSQVANTVSSRLSVKTDIMPVTYDRALAAVEGTEMYDYRYTNDDTGQHYVSGIIDDINPEPQYHMDGMLINKERTARIDANLLGYHQVVIQKLLERVATLEAKLNNK